MPIRDNREYRNLVSFDIKSEDENNYLVEGYASTYDTYDLFEADGVTYKEKILPEAFENCDMSDVVFLKDHTGTVYARTKNATLLLSIDEHGLKVRADLSKTAGSREAHEEIASGLYSQMSFAFIVDDDEYDQRTHTRTIRHIKKIYDVSYVSFPANYFTDIATATRSRFDGFIEEEKADLLAREHELQLAKEKFNFLKGEKQ